LIALAKSKPDQLIYASTGIGGLTHLGTELLSNMADIRMVHVPYKSTGAAMMDLLSGQCQLVIGSLLPMLPYLKAGKMRPLAVTTEQRWYALPEIPAIAETLPGYEVRVAFGVMAPRGIPKSVVADLNRAVNGMLEDNDTRKNIEQLGLAPSGGTPERFTAFTRADYQRWLRVAERAGIKVQ
jgi:tripartite-type tricarboxylate transporter receptor subunit TctC